MTGWVPQLPGITRGKGWSAREARAATTGSPPGSRDGERRNGPEAEGNRTGNTAGQFSFCRCARRRSGCAGALDGSHDREQRWKKETETKKTATQARTVRAAARWISGRRCATSGVRAPSRSTRASYKVQSQKKDTPMSSVGAPVPPISPPPVTSHEAAAKTAAAAVAQQRRA